MTAVEKVVADFARENRRDLWPRFTARAAGVTTAEAREAMLDLVGAGLLDLWYVVISDGDEVKRFKHPETAPLGAVLTNYRADEPEPFTVEPEDIYLMFSPTDRLATIAGKEDDPRPKGAGAESTVASAPVPARPTDEEQATRSPRWDPDSLQINVIFGDFVGGDKVGGDKVGGSKIVGGDSITGNKTTTTTTSASPPKKKTASAVVITLGIGVAVACAIVFYLLGHDGTLSPALAIPLGVASFAGSIAISNMIASHLRS